MCDLQLCRQAKTNVAVFRTGGIMTSTVCVVLLLLLYWPSDDFIHLTLPSYLAVNRHGSTLAVAQADKALATVICNIVCLFDVVHTVVIWCYIVVHMVLSVCIYCLSPLEATGCLQGLLWWVCSAKLHQALWKTHKPHFAASFFSCCLCYYFRWIVF